MAKKTSAQVKQAVMDLFRARRNGIMDMYRHHQDELNQALGEFVAYYGPDAAEGLFERVRLKVTPTKQARSIQANGMLTEKPKIRRRRRPRHGCPTIKSMLDDAIPKVITAMGKNAFQVRPAYDRLIKDHKLDPRVVEISHVSLYLSRHAEALGLKTKKVKPERGRAINEFTVIKKRRTRKPVRVARKTAE